MIGVAGIGSRDWNTEQLERITRLSAQLAENYDYLSTGNAIGSDHAFAQGFPPHRVTLYLPWLSYNEELHHQDNLILLATAQDLSCAEVIWNKHSLGGNRPQWDSLKTSIQELMGRNYSIVADKAAAEVYAAPKLDNGEYAGGTRFGILIAKELGKPVNILNFELNKVQKNVYKV